MMNIFTQLYSCGCKCSYHLNFIMWAHLQELKVYGVCCKTNISMCADTQHRLTELLFLALQVWTRFLLFKSWQLPILQVIKSLLVSKPKYWGEKNKTIQKLHRSEISWMLQLCFSISWLQGQIAIRYTFNYKFCS